MKRLIDDAPTADEEGTDTSPDDDQNQEEGTQQLDPVDTLNTQPLDPVELLDRDSTPIQPMRRKVAIPHVDNTLHDVTTVSGMDLQTKKTKKDGYHL